MARFKGGSSWLWIGLTCVLVGSVLLLYYVAHLSLQTAAGIASIVEAIPVILKFPLWRGRSTRTAVTIADVARGKEVLAGLVEQQWRAEALLRLLGDPDPIPVQWQLTRNAQVMSLPANRTSASLQNGAASDQIDALVREFQRMRRRRLVILGDPGAGKTTLAVQLLLGLLSCWRPDEPVPVLLPVADWDTTAFPQLHNWLTARLEQDYPALRAPEFGSGMAETLAKRGHILPVLDGLDELPPSTHAGVITALNRSLGDADQVILTSRTTEFTQAVYKAGNVLTSAAVIEPLPLTPAVAADYLRSCLPPRPGPVWEQILTNLRTAHNHSAPAAALAQIVSTPLGLWLLRATYITPRTDPTPLLHPRRPPTAADLRAHLFDLLIPALIAARPPSTEPGALFRPRRAHDPRQVHHRLSYLAHRLNRTPTEDGRTGTRDFAWWQLARHILTPRALRLTVGLTSGLTGGLMVALAFRLVVGPGWALAGGLAGGLVVGLVVGLAALSWLKQKPGFAKLGRRPTSLSHLHTVGRTVGVGLAVVYVAIVVGLVGGLVTVLVELGLKAPDGPAAVVFGLVPVLAGGLAVGLVGGPIKWVETPTPEDRASTPLITWQADRSLNLLRTLASGLAVGLGPGLVVGLVFGLVFGIAGGIKGALVSGLWGGLVSGLGLGLVFGLMGGLVAGRHHAWLAYSVATYLLAWRRLLPRQLMPFLDDMHRLGLLRAVGPIYQFRHAELQVHLAETYRSSRERVPA